MPRLQDHNYEYISSKMASMKEVYPSLRRKSDPYVFSALCVKSSYYKNPALVLEDSDFQEMIVDGTGDGGVDVLFSDPSSEGSDLILAQSKYYQAISFDEVMSALNKMAGFYKDMIAGRYDGINERVQRRFLTLNSDVGDESKIVFVLYTSAPKGGIRQDRVEKRFKDLFSDSSNIELILFFAPDLIDEIKESESRRPTVEAGKVKIDQAGNVLEYGDDAVIVNVSALSIKELYAQHNTNLLARNLRYHIAGREIDGAISETINSNPESFWMKNNGITIICESFRVDGKEVKLSNFSIVNGGQTTYMIYKNKRINTGNDFYLPCKVIRVLGDNEDEKNQYSLEIAKAVNSQKAIKKVDLKANSPEQVRFVQAMREVGVFYQTKRGEIVPRAYKEPHLNTDLVEVGKLCLGAIFQIPCVSRTKPSSLYQPKYYDLIFNSDQSQIAQIVKELLYIDHYFRTTFIKEFDRINGNAPMAEDLISFAHNARTICIAFVSFAARYQQGNISDQDISVIGAAQRSESALESLYDIFKNIEGFRYLFSEEVLQHKDRYDTALSRLFYLIITAGNTTYSIAKGYDPTLTATNFLKKDKNYYNILGVQWIGMKSEVQKIFNDASSDL